MINVKVVYTENAQAEALKLMENENISISYIHDKKEDLKARRFKHHWGATKAPFAIVEIDEKPVKAFYAEEDENVIPRLIDYLNTLD